MITITKAGSVAEVRFKYDPEYVERIRTIPGRKWNPDKKVWTVPINALPALLDRFEGEYKLIGEFPELVQMAMTLNVERIPETPLEPFEFKTEPRPYQVVGWNFGITRPAMLLGDEQGLGKTKQTIDIAEHRMNKGEVRQCLIIAKATLKYNWAQEIALHGRRPAIVIDGKNRDEKIRTLNRAVEEGIPYIITNYEQVRDYIDEFAAVQWDMVVADEAHKLKNHRSGIGKAIHKIKAKYKYALTGTPIINRPDEVYNIMKWLGLEKRGYWAFLKEYALLGGWTGWEIIGYKPGAIEKLHRNLASIMLRRTKADVLKDLPEKTHRTVWVELGPEQRRVYDQIKYNLRSELLDENGKLTVGHMIALTKILRLKQAAGSLELLGGKPISAKIDVVKELVEEIVEAEQKVLIFTQFIGMYNALKRELAEYGVVGIDGSMEAKNRQEVVNQFQNDPNVRVFVGMAPACREGLTLTAANNVIFVDLEWSPKYVEQAEDRAHRIGQKNPVVVTKVLAKDTIDEAIERLLEEKRAVFEALVEGKNIEGMEGDLISRLLV